jgi:predicted dehydrogenase
MDDLRIGVIGTGGRGGIALHAHRPGAGARVVACCDVQTGQLEQARHTYGADVFTTSDYRALLARDLDAVFITTPDYCHEEQAIAALEAGKAVYLEKPMAITTEGCDRILATAYTHGTRLFVGHNMRHMIFVLKMKELIDNGAIGEVKAAWCRHFVGHGGDFYFKDWHAERKHTTSLLLQKGAHDIDVLHWLCGGYTQMVTGMGGLTLYDSVTDRRSPDQSGDVVREYDRWPPQSYRQLHPTIDVEDISMVLMQLDNGVFASYQQCHYTPDYWRNYTVIGTKGRIENFGDIGRDTVVRLWNRRSDYNGRGDADYAVGGGEGDHGGADLAIINEFLRFAREGGKTNTSPIAARYSVAAGVAAAASLRAGSVPQRVWDVAPELSNYFAEGQR